MEEVCERLDEVLLEVMSTLRELSQLRERYSEAVKEVNSLQIITSQMKHVFLSVS